MEFIYVNKDKLFEDFGDLIAYVECGEHFDKTNNQHVEWLKRKLCSTYLLGGMSICVYEENKPVGFLLYQHDLGLENVCCFGKMAKIVMFGVHEVYRNQGVGKRLLEKMCKKVEEDGAECIYTDTYLLNEGAINFYSKYGFEAVAIHEGENGLEDVGQLYMIKKLK